jgi:hypothetical protein
MRGCRSGSGLRQDRRKGLSTNNTNNTNNTNEECDIEAVSMRSCLFVLFVDK